MNHERTLRVAVVLRAACAAAPGSDAQAFEPFGPGVSATGAALLGGARLVNLLEPHACVIALVLQHGSKRAPPGVQDGLGHKGLGERLGVHIAHEDHLMRAHQSGREFVQEVIPAVGNLGIEGPHPVLAPGALSHRQRFFQVAVEPLDGH